jgi:hypothetical protein
MPFFGLELLGMARDVAAFNLPARAGSSSGSAYRRARAGGSQPLEWAPSPRGGHFVDRRQVGSKRLGDHDPAGPSRAGSGVEVIPQPGAAPSPLSSSGLRRRQRATAPLERRSLALSPPLDRYDGSPLPAGSATSEPAFEVENLDRWAQAEPSLVTIPSFDIRLALEHPWFRASTLVAYELSV